MHTINIEFINVYMYVIVKLTRYVIFSSTYVYAKNYSIQFEIDIGVHCLYNDASGYMETYS